MRFPVLLFLLSLFPSCACFAAPEDDNTLMAVRSADASIPYQGPCTRPVDRHTGTAVCYGGSQGMINIEYQNGARVCVYA
jgi:hypothetical protein